MSLLPLINPASNDEWIQFIGKYMINMGAIEATSRIIIGRLNGTDQVKIFSADLAARLQYLRARYPNDDKEKHKRAMNLFDVLSKHVIYRNIVAHSSVVYEDGPGGEKVIVGLLNFKPSDKKDIAEVISIDEMKGRVDESAKLGSILLEMQNDFKFEKSTHHK
jgi:hypothetical protein